MPAGAPPCCCCCCTTLLLLLLQPRPQTHTQGRSRWGRTEGGRRAEKTQTQPGCHRSTLTQALWWMMNKQHFPILASFASLLFPAPPVRAWWLHDGNIKKSWILFKEVVIKVIGVSFPLVGPWLSLAFSCVDFISERSDMPAELPFGRLTH